MDLTLSLISETRVNLAWRNRSSVATALEIERMFGSGQWVKVATLSTDATSYPDSGLKPGAKYTYRVGAVDRFGTSWSAPASVETTIPPASGPAVSKGMSAGPTPAAATWAGIRFSTDTIKFPQLRVGAGAGVVRGVKAASTGKAPLVVRGVSITGGDAADFSIDSNFAGRQIPPGVHWYFYVVFKPTAVGPRTAFLTFDDNAPGSPHKVLLQGTGMPHAR
jgi:hypothetical protein